MDVNVLVLLSITLLHWIQIGPIECTELDGGCVFVETEVQCEHLNLSYIPELPSNVTGLVFSDNFLPNITSSTFNNISKPGHLFDLYLSYNKVTTISEDSFSSFSRLTYLDLSGNHIASLDLKHLLGSLCHRNITVALNSIGSAILQSETFSLMKQCDLFGLYLRKDKYVNISQNMTKHFENVEQLHFDHNRIKKIQLPYMKRLRSLSLNYNMLSQFPDFCLPSPGTSLVPVIKTLFIRNNWIIELSSQNFECLTSLEVLDISGNYITVFPDDLLLHLPAIRMFVVADNNGHLTRVEKHAFRSNSLEYLSLSVDGSVSSIFDSLNDTFKYLPNLKDLYLGYISMFDLPKYALYALFAPLDKLEHFSCFSCKIQGDPSAIFDNKENIMMINFGNNFIDKISNTLLKSKQYLKVLKLKRNKLVHLSSTAFPVNLLNRFDLVDLSENPFSCDCALEWFIDWLKITTNILEMKKQSYVCASPQNYVGKKLIEVKFSYLECHPLKTWMWVMIVGLPTLFVLLVISLIMYRNRWNIKHYIYLLRKRKNYIPIEGVELLYDAFVSYNQSDSGWVVDRLIPILEDAHKCKLCIHERDFHVGAYINDNIVRCIEESKRMILVLSDDFATSGWCMFELKIALSKHIEDEFEVIVILLKPIHGRNMNKSIKTILEMTTYLEWTEDVVGEELFWNKLRDGMGVGNNIG